MGWFPLALLSAFAIATADALTKRHFSNAHPWDATCARFVWSGVLLLPWAWLEWSAPSSPWFWAWLAALLPLDLLAVWLYVRAITSAPLSHTVPYLSFSPVFTLVVGWALLGERPGPAGAAGVLLITVGAYLLNGATRSSGGWLGPFKAMASERGPRLMLLVALIFSVTGVLGKGAVQYMPGAAFGGFYGIALAAITLAAMMMRGRSPYAVLRARPFGTFAVAAGMAVMVVTHFLAIEQVSAAYMIAVKRTSMLFGLVYGAWWFRELALGRNFFAALLMLGGVALIVVR